MAYALAIEASSRHGAIALGRVGQSAVVRELPPQRRHNVALMPTIAALCAEQCVGPADLDQVYVSSGPGSFTSLRIAMTTVRMLALTRGVRVVSVPTLDVLAANVKPGAALRLAVCVNLKHESAWSCVYEPAGDGWRAIVEPALRDGAQLREAAGSGAMHVLGDPLPAGLADDPDVTVLPNALAAPRADKLWQRGQALAAVGRFTDPADLLPLYAREPEAVTLWNRLKA